MTRSDIIEQILPLARLAASAHNTQPWDLSVSDDLIQVFISPSRHLTVSDPDKRQLYISLGCLIGNIKVAAAHAGLAVNTRYFPHGKSESEPVAELELKKSGDLEQPLAALYSAIALRRTDRSLYDAQPFTQTERQQLTQYHSPYLRLIEDKETIGLLAKITGEGSFQTLQRRDFKEELSHWVRPNFSRKPDGMPGYAMGIPAPITPFISWVVQIAPIHKQEQTNTAKQMRSSSAIAVFMSDHDEPTEWLAIGEDFKYLWLQATRLGLAVAPLAAAVEASHTIREETRQALKSDQLPQAILRIGHSSRKVLKASPRRTVADCLR